MKDGLSALLLSLDLPLKTKASGNAHLIFHIDFLKSLYIINYER